MCSGIFIIKFRLRQIILWRDDDVKIDTIYIECVGLIDIAYCLLPIAYYAVCCVSKFLHWLGH